MTEDEVPAWIARLDAALERLHRVPIASATSSPEPDPITGETWDQGNVLGHMADILPFWTGELAQVLAGKDWIGRGENGYQARLEAIQRGGQVAEGELRAEIDQGVAAAKTLIARLKPSDLDHGAEHRRATETRLKSIRELVDQLVVGHFESHVEQVERLHDPRRARPR